MNLILAPAILDDVIQHARAAYPREGCGLIIGLKESTVGSRFIAMTNVAQSAAEFEMDPAELINTFRELRNAGQELVATYHSHPHGPPRPSRTDVQRAYYPEAAHLIVSLADLERPKVAAFRIIDGEVLDIEVHAIV